MKFYHNFLNAFYWHIKKFSSKLCHEPSDRIYNSRQRLIMRLNLLFAIVFLTFMQVSANTYGQKININQKEISLTQALKIVRDQSGFDVVYDAKLVQNLSPISLNLKDATLEEALKTCLSYFNLSYKLEEQTVVIQQKSVFAKISDQLSGIFADDETTGYVYDGIKPLAGATVTVKRTKKTVYTDNKGNFSVKDILNTDSLIIGFIGYQTQTVAVKKDLSKLFISMTLTSNPLDMVVVQGYGKTTQRLATGNIARVTASDISKQIIENPLMALQGAVPGLEISSIDGNEFGIKRIELRGRKGINQLVSGEPLIIVDGVPQTVLNELGAGLVASTESAINPGLSVFGATEVQGFSPLYNIDPKNIESIEVLVDADATAIYGSRGGNGVILITTKKGSSGKTTIEASTSQGIKQVIKKWDLLDTEEYLDYRREVFRNDGINPNLTNALELVKYDQNSYTDWQDFVYGRNGNTSNYNVGISGGDNKTTFRLNSTLNTNKDITNFNGLNQRFSSAISLNHSLLNQIVNVGLQASYATNKNNQVNVQTVHTAPPNAPSLFTESGDFNFQGWGTDLTEFVGLKKSNNYNGEDINIALNLKISPFKNLNFTFLGGLSSKINNTRAINPLSAYNPNSTTTKNPSIVLSNTKVQNYIFEPQLDYRISIGKANLTALLGGTYQDNRTIGLYTNYTGFKSDEQMSSVNAATGIKSYESLRNYKYLGAYMRLNFNYLNKYLVNINARRDGSSRFGTDYRFGNFGAIGVAWILSDEAFIANILPKQISYLKLRASYGIVGSDGVGDYKYLNQWGNQSNSLILPNYDGVLGYVPQLLANSEYRWQRNNNAEVGLNIGFFNDSINLGVQFYQNSTNNQLVSYPTAAYMGFTEMVYNSPAEVKNSGIGLDLNAKIVNKKIFSWNTTFTFGHNKNVLVGFPNFELSPYYNLYKIGQPLSNIYLLKSNGVDPLTGEYTFFDANGDGKISVNAGSRPGESTDDRVIAIDLAPKFSGNFTNSFRFKNLSLSATFYYTKKKARAIDVVAGNSNISQYLYDNTWRQPGDEAIYSKFTNISKLSNAHYNSSDLAYKPIDFIRLQSIQIAYRLPEKFSTKIGVKNLTLSGTAQNIFVISKYHGPDPEVMSIRGMPQTRTFNFGLNCNF